MSLARIHRVGLVVLLPWLWIAAQPAQADILGDKVPDEVSVTADKLDSEVDSDPDDKSDRFRILPIPIFITEPAIGNGLGVALTLFHPVKNVSRSSPVVSTPASIAKVDEDRDAPPVVSSLFGAYTSTSTWAAGIGHSNHWREDSIRYTGIGAVSRINSEFFIFGLPVQYTLDGALVYQDLKFRIGDSDFFIGAGLNYLNADVAFEPSFPGDDSFGVPEPLLDLDIRNVGLAARGFYDTRDNVLNPTTGYLAELSLWRFDNALGGDYDYWNAKIKALAFFRMTDSVTLGFRLEAAAVDGRLPFFAYPWVKLRGIPAMRYQNTRAGAIEAEARYQFRPKWQVLAFAGLGRTSEEIKFFENPKHIYNLGVGARYQVLESHKVWMGIDIARGPEEWAWYIQVGHPW